MLNINVECIYIYIYIYIYTFAQILQKSDVRFRISGYKQ